MQVMPSVVYRVDKGLPLAVSSAPLVAEKQAGRVQAQARAHREQQILQTVHLNAAGIDVGSASHWVVVPADRDDHRDRHPA